MRSGRWPRAICSMCGYAYMRKIWKHSHLNGIVRCGVRTCSGKLWIVPNAKTGFALIKLDREQRANHAKLHIIGDKVER